MASEFSKTCTACGFSKPLGEFHKNKNCPLGVTNQCKDCRNEIAREWKRTHRDSVQATYRKYHASEKYRAAEKLHRLKYRDRRRVQCKEWHKRHPEKGSEYNLKRKLRTLGITFAEYQSFGEVCGICGQKEPNGHRLHIDHCHATGKTRGLLCEKHNLMVGLSGDSVEILQRAISYLNGSQ